MHEQSARIESRSVVGLGVRISAFQADGPGSIPGRRIYASGSGFSETGEGPTNKLRMGTTVLRPRLELGTFRV